MVAGAFGGGLLGYFGKCTSGACPLTASPLRGAIVGTLIAGLFALSWWGHEQSAPPAAQSNRRSHILDVDSVTTFNNNVLQADSLVLVDFYATWCAPCRRLTPVLEELAADHGTGNLLVAKVNVDKHRDLAKKYAVRGVPYLVLMKGGKPVATKTGYLGRKPLDAWIEQYR